MLTDLFTDSRAVEPNSVFVALQGEKTHGNAFITQALEKGATLILTDTEVTSITTDIPIITLANLKKLQAKFADWFYDSPSQQLKLIGITGTNGKTSTAYYTAQLLEGLGYPTGLLGTLGNGRFNQLKPSPNTTLETITLQRTLSQFVKEGLVYCVMEVSSHAISLGRIDACQFECVALTQVTRDHLDFHGTVEAYQAVKQSFLEKTPSQYRVVNLNDSVGQAIKKIEPLTMTYALDNNLADISCTHIRYHDAGVQAQCEFKEQSLQIESPLMGQFNVENLACALAIIWPKITESMASLLPMIKKLQAVPGRMQKIIDAPCTLVDYAHTPDGMKAVLQAINEHQKQGQLWVVFGCGGDRDKGKRPLMGKIAETYAEQVIVTNDNPRCENEQDIIKEILQGMNGTPYIELDRHKAIELALSNANPQDWVAVLGKGHETTQVFCHQVEPFDDTQVIRHWTRR